MKRSVPSWGIGVHVGGSIVAIAVAMGVGVRPGTGTSAAVGGAVAIAGGAAIMGTCQELCWEGFPRLEANLQDY